jgi:hypothetical protein
MLWAACLSLYQHSSELAAGCKACTQALLLVLPKVQGGFFAFCCMKWVCIPCCHCVWGGGGVLAGGGHLHGGGAGVADTEQQRAVLLLWRHCLQTSWQLCGHMHVWWWFACWYVMRHAQIQYTL